MGASSVRRQEIYRTTDQDEDADLEATTMAPLAAQVIAAMMNDEALEGATSDRPSGFRVKDPDPTLDEQATVPLTSTLLKQVVADVDARAAARLASAPPVKQPSISAGEIGVFVLTFSVTASTLLFAFFG